MPTPQQQAFNKAMERHDSNPVYVWFSGMVALSNVGLQVLLLSLTIPQVITNSLLQIFLLLLVVLYLTDLINGLVHIFMDNYGNYEHLAGPLVAHFHLHHKTPLYRKRGLLAIYFLETGAKVWLVAYLLAVLGLHQLFPGSSILVPGLALIGVFSSVAEVSHYLCHSSNHPVARALMRAHILLNKKHHALHHTQDNTNYAFLNGWSDPLLNWIAKRWFPGYKEGTDLHYAQYQATDPARGR